MEILTFFHSKKEELKNNTLFSLQKKIEVNILEYHARESRFDVKKFSENFNEETNIKYVNYI